MPPPYGLVSTGFSAKTANDVFDEMATDQIGAIGPLWNARRLSIIGVINSIFSAQLGIVWEGLQATYGQFDPRDAEGNALDSDGELRGVLRLPRRRSVVFCNCLMVPGTIVAQYSMIAHVVGDTTRRFRNSFPFTVPGVGVSTTVSVQFESEEYGPIEAPAGLLTVPDTAFPGWITGTITNPLDAIRGAEVESDADYRLRQEQELARGGSATQPALVAAIGAVPDVSSVVVLANDTDATVDTIPPHSFEAIVEGGTVLAVAETIFNEKAPGDGTNGSTTQVVNSPDGLAFQINFTRPTNVSVWLRLDVRVTSEFAGGAFLAAFIAGWADRIHAAGADVVPSRIAAKCFEFAGVYDVPVSFAGFSNPAVSPAILVVGVRQRADFDVTRIAVTVVP